MRILKREPARTLKIGQGWKIAGIFTGNLTRWNRDNQEYRACEVSLYQFINDGKNMPRSPRSSSFTPTSGTCGSAWKASIPACIGRSDTELNF